LTSEDKKNFVNLIQNAIAYGQECQLKLTNANKKVDVPVHPDVVQKYTHKFETVSWQLTHRTCAR
jgi:hypothetical protein